MGEINYRDSLRKFNGVYKGKMGVSYPRMSLIEVTYENAIKLELSELKGRIILLEKDLMEIGKRDYGSKWLCSIIKNAIDNYRWCIMNYEDNHSMYKILGIVKGEMDGNKLLSANHKVIKECGSRNLQYEELKEFIEINSEECIDYDLVCVVRYFEGKPRECGLGGQLREDNEAFVDSCEWDDRVLVSVALGFDLI